MTAAAAATSDVPDIEDLIRVRDYDPCDCIECSETCVGTPGAYDPEHIQRLLDKGFTMADLAPTMVEHYSISGPRPVLLLRPRTDVEEPGSQVPFLTLPGKCVHLGEKGCTLARPHMPIICISSYCCKGQKSPGAGKVRLNKRHLRDMWTSEQGQKILRLFREESMKQNPEVKLGEEALGQQMWHYETHVPFAETAKFEGRMWTLRNAMKNKVNAARRLELLGEDSVACVTCKHPARLECERCGTLCFCSEACAQNRDGSDAHSKECVDVDTEREELLQKRKELMKGAWGQ